MKFIFAHFDTTFVEIYRQMTQILACHCLWIVSKMTKQPIPQGKKNRDLMRSLKNRAYRSIDCTNQWVWKLPFLKLNPRTMKWSHLWYLSIDFKKRGSTKCARINFTSFDNFLKRKWILEFRSWKLLLGNFTLAIKYSSYVFLPPA